MLYLKLLCALLFPAILGTCFVSLFLNKKEDAPLLARIAFGYLIGLMLITAEMFFVLPAIHLKYSVLSISTPLLIFVLWGLFPSIKNRLFEIKTDGLDLLKHIQASSPLEKIILILIGLNVFFVFSTVMLKPVVGVDAWANYSLRAKVYYLEGTTNVSSLPEADRGQYNGLTQTWVFTCINQWNDVLGKINFPFYYLCLLIIFYYSARRTQSRFPSLLATYLLATLPFLVYHATLEYSDLLLATYLFAGVSLVFLWFNNPRLKYLILAAIFLFSTTTIKNEAYFHLAILFTIFSFTLFSKKFVTAQHISKIRTATIICIFSGGIYTLVRLIYLQSRYNYFSAHVDFSRIMPLFSVFGDYLFVRSNWGLLWFILVLVIIFNYKRIKELFNLSLFYLVVFEIFGLMAFYFFAEKTMYSWLFFLTPAVRNMLQFMPIVLFLLVNMLTIENCLPLSTLLNAKQLNNPPQKKKH